MEVNSKREVKVDWMKLKDPVTTACHISCNISVYLLQHSLMVEQNGNLIEVFPLLFN